MFIYSKKFSTVRMPEKKRERERATREHTTNSRNSEISFAVTLDILDVRARVEIGLRRLRDQLTRLIYSRIAKA